MHEKTPAKDQMAVLVGGRSGLAERGMARGHWRLRAYNEHGVLVAERDWENLVTTVGKNHLLDVGFRAQSQATWYLGLTDGTPTVNVADTAASHAGWTEVTAYDESARQAWTANAAASGAIDNSGSEAVFTISTNSTTIGGAFMISSSTKGGTTGILYAVGPFSGGDLTLNDGSTLTLSSTFSL